jgi:YgiT-type zinc finger domain-containing protein
MTCAVCEDAELQAGVTTVTLQREGLRFVFKAVPAQICPGCGEAYVSEGVAVQLLASAEELAHSGAQTDVRLFAPAP